MLGANHGWTGPTRRCASWRRTTGRCGRRPTMWLASSTTSRWDCPRYRGVGVGSRRSPWPTARARRAASVGPVVGHTYRFSTVVAWAASRHDGPSVGTAERGGSSDGHARHAPPCSARRRGPGAPRRRCDYRSASRRGVRPRPRPRQSPDRDFHGPRCQPDRDCLAGRCAPAAAPARADRRRCHGTIGVCRIGHGTLSVAARAGPRPMVLRHGDARHLRTDAGDRGDSGHHRLSGDRPVLRSAARLGAPRADCDRQGDDRDRRPDHPAASAEPSLSAQPPGRQLRGAGRACGP